MNLLRYCLCVVLLAAFMQLQWTGQAFADNFDDFDAAYEVSEPHVADPLEPLNRAFFQFNDKLYFWLIKPVSKVYAAVVPEDFRMCIGNAFHNILGPVRVVNNLLQGKVHESGTELMRFVINTTAGAGGLGDPAKDVFHLTVHEEDLGQTLGKYGMGDGIFICWPFLGPSNLRDTIGLVGDSFLNPLFYITASDFQTGLAVNSGKRVNHVSLTEGDYEQFLESNFDPYAAMRNFYTQNRKSAIRDRLSKEEQESSTKTVEILPKRMKIVKQAALKNSAQKKFFVQVGAFTQIENSQLLIEQLVQLKKNPVIVEFIREDYHFYGIQIPAGDNFLAAKQEELELNKHGLKETALVVR